MAAKKKSDEKNWYESPTKKYFAIIMGFISICYLGYGFAVIQKNIEFRMEKFELSQEFNQKLQTQKISCDQEKQELENKRVEALENVVLELSKKMK